MVSTLAFHAIDPGSIPARGGGRFFVVLFEFVFLITVPYSSSKSFSINTTHIIKKTSHFLVILGNMSVSSDHPIYFDFVGQRYNELAICRVWRFYSCLLNHVLFFRFFQKPKLSQPQMKQKKKAGKKNKTRGAWATTLT